MQELRAVGLTPTQIAREMGIARASVYLALKVAPEDAARISAEIAERQEPSRRKAA